MLHDLVRRSMDVVFPPRPARPAESSIAAGDEEEPNGFDLVFSGSEDAEAVLTEHLV